MEARADYLSEMALVYYDANQPAEGDQTLRRALEISRNSDTDYALGLRLQIAGAFMEQGKTGRAIEIFGQTTLSHPNTPNGWEGLVGAYTRVGDFAQAITAVRSMPQHAYDVAVTDAGFLNSVAVLYSSQGQCGEAEDFLNRSLVLDQSQGRQPAEGTQLQLADIMMRERNYSRAHGGAIWLCFSSSTTPGPWCQKFPTFRPPSTHSLKLTPVSWSLRPARTHLPGAIRMPFRYCRKRVHGIRHSTGTRPLFWISRLRGRCSPSPSMKQVSVIFC